MEKNPIDNSKQNSSEEEIRPLRTYEDDVAQLVQGKQLSKAKIVMAEEKRRQQNPDSFSDQPKKKNKTPLKIIASLIFIGLGAATIFLAFKYDLVPQQIAQLVTPKNGAPDIISKQSTIKITTDNKRGPAIKQEIVQNLSQIQENVAGQIIGFEMTKTETIIDENQKEKQVEVNITTRDLFEILESVAEDRLIRSMDDIFLLGVYTGIKNVPFLILKTTDIDLSFSEVYQWERNMYNDLNEILLLQDEVPDFIDVEVATSSADVASTTPTENSTSTNESLVGETGDTSSTTPGVLNERIENPAPKFNPREFTDLVLSNRDVRAIIDEAGEIILMYSFVDDENIIFTKDQKVFQEIIKKLSARKLVR